MSRHIHSGLVLSMRVACAAMTVAGVGCGGGVVDGPQTRDGGLDGAAATTDAGGSAADAAAGVCGTCPAATLAWRRDGGFVAYQDDHTLVSCQAYARVRTNRGSTAGGPSCTGDLACRAATLDVDAARVAEALGSPDVVAARAKAPALYGADARASDGQVLRIEIDGKLIEVGSPCGATGVCTAIPPGVASLAAVLDAIGRAQQATGTCAAAFPDGR